MHETAIAACVERLERVTSALRTLMISTAVALGLSVAAFVWAPRQATVMLITAVFCAAGAAWMNDMRVEYLEWLAIDRDAYRIPAVRRFGERLITPVERRRLAAGLLCAVERATGQFGLTAPSRLEACASVLCEVAEQLCDRQMRVAPTSAAACRRLLGRTADSPLYNEELLPEDLTAALFRIRAGIVSS